MTTHGSRWTSAIETTQGDVPVCPVLEQLGPHEGIAEVPLTLIHLRWFDGRARKGDQGGYVDVMSRRL
jgi:hypothetical protein